MSDRLPDELISEILSPALKVPEHMFSNTSPKSPFASLSVLSKSSALLVCKSWLRVATPLLYAVVIIRSKAQAHAFQATLRSTPDLGRFVKKLRVEGGFGTLMHRILQNTPNVTDILLSLQIHSSDSSSGLVLGLPLINPTRLIIFDNTDNLLKNKAVLQLMRALETCVAKWSNLNTIHFPYKSRIAARESFCTALATRSIVKTLSFPIHHSSFLPFLVKIAQTPSLKAIEIRPDSTHKQTSLLTSTDPRLDQLLRWGNTPTNTKSLALVPIDSSFRPLASTPQPTADRIWSRILFFAMLSLGQHPQSTPSLNLPDTKTNSGRLQFLLVSKLFLRLALPYLYRYPVFIYGHNFSLFSHALTSRPTLGRHVWQLVLWPDQDRRSQFFALIITSRATGSIASIFPHTSNLTHLIASNNSISWSEFITLAKTAGSTLQEFTGFYLTSKKKTLSKALAKDTTLQSPAVFSRFTALRSFIWDSGIRVGAPPFFSAVDEATVAALSTLEFLGMETSDALSVFSRMHLPSLNHAALANRTDWDPGFLRTHGSKITVLEVEKATIGTESVFQLCPNISTLTCRVNAGHGYDFGCARLPDGFQQTFLTKIVVKKDPMYYSKGKDKEEMDWVGFFRALDTSHLPALREVSIPSFEWPTTDHTIAKSMWVEWAEILLARGIKLTDVAGMEWRPRLKASRR
ncbi:hypothetical protein C8R44DRAFT_864686 [Mycena epipterygia]|nr:hypothetical protein C8R44DRAFT_864686 [Mycena epipterygia]